MSIDQEFTHTDEVLTDVAKERLRQDERFGGPVHDDNQGVYFSSNPSRILRDWLDKWQNKIDTMTYEKD